MENDQSYEKLNKSSSLDKEKPNRLLPVSSNENEPQERSKERFVRFVIESIRRKTFESAEKHKLRKKLRLERNRIRKIQRTEKRRRRMGREILSETTDIEKE